MTLATVEEAIEEFRHGRFVIIIDDQERENEGDLCLPAQFVDADAINFMAKYGRGLICLSMTEQRAQQLRLELMARHNGARNRTAFTVSIEAKEGIATGISAHDRALTIATAIDPNISIATVYRTVRLFEEAGILAKHDFGDGRARYEETPQEHPDHLIDIQSGKVVEFHNDEIEELQRRIAEKAGYKLVGHRLELYGVPLNGKTERQK